MIPKTDDGRVLFAVPWHGKVLLGTTDTPVDKPDLEPVALEEEVEFILKHASRYLSVSPSRKDVRSVFVGLRPLVKGGEDESDTSSISRDHTRSEEHTSELQSRAHLVCRLLLEKQN